MLKKWANRSFPLFWWVTMSASLRSLRRNERFERTAHFAHQKWANEWIANFFEQITHLLIFGQKTSDFLGNQMSEFPALHECPHAFVWSYLTQPGMNVTHPHVGSYLTQPGMNVPHPFVLFLQALWLIAQTQHYWW